MSFRYSSCFSFSSPNIRSPRTSENPMMAFSGVRSSWDMLARNSDLCWLADFELPALVLDLPEEPRVLDGQGRLGGEGLQQLDRSRRELAGRLRDHGETADQLVFADAAARRGAPGTPDSIRFSRSRLS